MIPKGAATVIAGLAALVPDMQVRALALDAAGDVPQEDIAHLRRLGALAAPVPRALGGLGTGTDPEGARAVADALRLIGQGNLSVGRLYEAHVNALRLIVRYGDTGQIRAASADALAGHLFALWVTDPPEAPLHLDADGRLLGAKAPCSGAGYATRALVTAEAAGGDTRMLLLRVEEGARLIPGAWQVQGMRAAVTGRMDFGGIGVGAEAMIGEAGDYLRQPEFSAGAWRTSAVTLGGIEALVGELGRQLTARGRGGDPHQRARMGEALIAQETARMWVVRASLLAEEGQAEAGQGDIANVVNLARIAVETAALDVIRLVQRSLGLGAFRTGSLTELLFRDLSTYLRQPAPDETLTDAAAWFMQRALPAAPGTA